MKILSSKDSGAVEVALGKTIMSLAQTTAGMTQRKQGMKILITVVRRNTVINYSYFCKLLCDLSLAVTLCRCLLKVR